MSTSQQRRIREILGEQEPDKDHSLRGQALNRANDTEAPRTLTAWEWEEWYRKHGVPAAHRQGGPAGRGQGPLRRWFKRLLGRAAPGD